MTRAFILLVFFGAAYLFCGPGIVVVAGAALAVGALAEHVKRKY